MTFFGPDFVPICSQVKFWVRYIENHMPKHARVQTLAQTGTFWSQDTFKALRWAKNALKVQTLLFPSALRPQMSSKSLMNQLFLYESLFSYILTVCVWIFRPKFKKQDFEVISGYLEKRITV